MKKIVGRMEVNTSLNINKDSQINIIKNYNPSTSASIRLDGLEDILDLEYILQTLKFKMGVKNEF